MKNGKRIHRVAIIQLLDTHPLALAENAICLEAVAEVQLTESELTQDIRSGGLWGITEKSPEYLKEVADEELACLRSQLHAIGFSKRAISAAFKGVSNG